MHIFLMTLYVCSNSMLIQCLLIDCRIRNFMFSLKLKTPLQCKEILEWQRAQMEAFPGGILGLPWMKNGIFPIHLSFLTMGR